LVGKPERALERVLDEVVGRRAIPREPERARSQVGDEGDQAAAKRFGVLGDDGGSGGGVGGYLRHWRPPDPPLSNGGARGRVSGSRGKSARGERAGVS